LISKISSFLHRGHRIGHAALMSMQILRNLSGRLALSALIWSISSGLNVPFRFVSGVSDANFFVSDEVRFWISVFSSRWLSCSLIHFSRRALGRICSLAARAARLQYNSFGMEIRIKGNKGKKNIRGYW